MAGPHGFEHGWRYVGGPGLPTKEQVSKLPHTKGSFKEGVVKHVSGSHVTLTEADDWAKHLTELHGGDTDAAKASLERHTSESDKLGANYGRKNRALARLAGKPVKGLSANPSGSRTSPVSESGNAVHHGSRSATTPRTGHGSPLPEGYKPGRRVAVRDLPEGVTVHQTSDKDHAGRPVEAVLHNGTLLGHVTKHEYFSHVRGSVGNISIGQRKVTEYRAEMPSALRRELGLDPRVARSVANRKANAVTDLVNTAAKARRQAR